MDFDKRQMLPAKAFWSVTMHDASYFFVPNPPNRYTLSSCKTLVTNPGAIPGGPNHVASETINGESKHLSIAIQNINYQHLQPTQCKFAREQDAHLEVEGERHDAFENFGSNPRAHSFAQRLSVCAGYRVAAQARQA